MGAHKGAKTEYLRAAITTTQHQYTVTSLQMTWLQQVPWRDMGSYPTGQQLFQQVHQTSTKPAMHCSTNSWKWTCKWGWCGQQWAMCKSCAGEMIATAHRDWCLRSAASLRFAMEGV